MAGPSIDASPLAAKKALAEEVADRLRQAIVETRFNPGERIREDHVAATLAVSRAPVREALLQLEREGLVVRRRHRGACVARLAASDAWEVFSLRLILDRFAIESAVASATEVDLGRLEAGLASLIAAVRAGAPLPDVTALDLDFHDLIYRASHHERLYRMWTELRPQVHILLLSGWGTSPSETSFARRMTAAHRELIEVIQARDVTRAVAATDAHVRRNYEAVVAAMPAEDAAGASVFGLPRRWLEVEGR
jgi:DNA-binding GntR family transcriptional regulator